MKYPFCKTLALFSLLALGLYSCQPEAPEEKLPDSAFLKYITAYTGGVVSASSAVDVHFNPEILPQLKLIRDEELAGLFRLKPSVAGEAYWSEDNILSFKPGSPLRSGQKYDVIFDLGKIAKVPAKLNKFRFTFEVIKQAFTVQVEGVYSDYEDFSLVKVKGAVLFADVLQPEDVEKILQADYQGKAWNVSWQHESGENVSRFTLDSIPRMDDESFLQLEWNGRPLGVDEQGVEKIGIPSKNRFEITRTTVFHQPEQYVAVLLSDPLSREQSLKGLITIDNAGEVILSTDRNEIKIYPETRLQGRQVLRIDGSVKSIYGKELGANQQIELSFDAYYPAVKFLASGNILPQSDKLVLPFQAVNLNAVDVRIIKIYENNIPQFLQTNNLSGNYQLNRVGRPILKKKIDLTLAKPADLGQWNTYFLDLGEMIRVDPEAIYNVRISFSQEYSVYPCDDNGQSSYIEEDDYYYYGYDEDRFNWDEDGYYYDDYYPPGFTWRERNNPCHVSYYYNEKFISRNILASNLGVMAKAGKDGTYTVVVTDLVSATPVNGARVELLNYQQQKMSEARTDSYGKAEIPTKHTPFLLIAEYNGQKSYLKLDDGSSLSLSKFDVEGEAVKEGLKGFIYGDRGVWRPGDSLFLVFILEDRNNSLPDDHPVIFELIDPSGKIVQNVVKTQGDHGFYNFSTATSPDARTGLYQAKVTIGNTTFRKILRIETIKPNRLKVGMDFDQDLLKANMGSTPATLSARWLHGGTASGLKATVSQIFTRKKVEFDGFKGFSFDDPGKDFWSEEKVIFEKNLDASGKATVQVDTKGNFNAPGMLTANFMVKVFEPSGEFSVGQFSVPYAPYPRFAGIHLAGKDKWGFLMADTAYHAELALVDEKGRPVSQGQLQVSVYSMEWRWWWNAGEDNMASYFSTSYRNPIHTETVSLTHGKGEFILNTEYMEWGRYYVKVTDPAGGHSAGTEFFVRWKSWWDQSGDEGKEFATMLEFNSDRKKYAIGETATISFPAGKQGKAWISLENGSRILRSDWIDITDNKVDYSFIVTPDMAPNIYVYVSLLQPHSQALNDLPLRLYGVIPILAEDPETILQPVIKAPDEIRPGEEYTLKVKEEKGKAMTYTLAVVDEGLLDLTRFRTPDPWKHFFAREALGVKTWDMYDRVIGAFGGKLERVLAVGGDETAPLGDRARLNRFKPVVQFIGPVNLKPRGQNTHKLVMPNYVGSVKVMVVAASEYPAYGMAEETVPVRQPLMVLATLPRVLGPGEKVRLPVNVFMMEENKRDVEVKVETNENITVQGSSVKKVTFAKAGDQLVEFDLAVAGRTGAGSVMVTVSSGREKATHQIDLEIRNPNPPVSMNYFMTLAGGERKEQEVVLPGMPGTNSLKMEVSSLLPLDLSGRMNWLLDYPYGCAEQITSAAFPQLYLGQLTDLSPAQQNRAMENVKSTITRLQRFQNRDGSFNFWPGYASGNDYITSYIGHFLVEARKMGYAVGNGMINPWISYQKSLSARWDSQQGDDLVQAYRLYSLALAGEPQLGPMNRLREQSGLSMSAASCLASAYAFAGQQEAARKIFEKYAFLEENSNRYSYTYGSRLRNQAMKLEALINMEEDEEAGKLALQISREFSKEEYYSTQTTAYVLQVLSRFVEQHPRGKELKYTYYFERGAKETVTTPFTFHKKEWENDGIPGKSLVVMNEGEGDMFISVTARGTPLQDNLPPQDKNLKVSVNYKDMEGNDVDVSNLRQGMDFKAVVTVSLSALPRGQDNLALSFVVPSGWEILKRSETGFEAGYSGKEFDYQDIRDDRVNTFFHLNPGQSKTFSFFLNATYQGTFFLPAIRCEAMYDEGIYSRGSGQWVKVVPSDQR